MGAVVNEMRYKIIPLVLIAFVILLSGCSSGNGAVEESEISSASPTATEAPMAARVNGEGITLSEFEAELGRLQSSQLELGIEAKLEEQQEQVLNEIINQVLLVQAATGQNFFVDEATLQERIDLLIQQIGGVEALQDWQTSHSYDDQSFRNAMQRNIAAAWMRDQIISTVPDTAEQVHARQILVREENSAVSIERQVQAGADFETLAFQYDPLTGGNLGWFPRGYLCQPDVEEAAFNLQTGGVSAIIQTSYGYHLVQLIEYDEQHPLSPDAKLFLQHQALEQWLEERRSESAIEILI